MDGAIEAGRYDVFVSYASADRSFAREFDASLRGSGVRTFIDCRELRAGVPWIVALEEAVNQSRAVAILIGRNGLGNVQQYERDLALVRQSRERDFPVIPVLIPGCESPPTGFLQLLTWVDLRDGLVHKEAAMNLLAALRRESATSASIRESICPYMGLEPFSEEDAAFFCGRAKAIGELVARVREHALVAVVGRSGSGKSSLVFAGLLPELRRQRPAVVWDVLSLRPGAWPLHALAAAFEDDSVPTGAVARDAKVDALAGHLRDGEDDKLARVAASRLDAAPNRPDKLLLYVDQWEELYSMGPAENETAKRRHARDVDRFIALLLAMSSDPRARTRVVFTVRADFYGIAMGHPTLGALLPRQQVNIGPLSREDLRAAIMTPAEKAGFSFEPASLVDEIVDDAGADEAVLPLLQYALKETWVRREGRLLTATGYTEAGGVDRAIKATADRIYQELDENEKALARRLFLGLVTPGEGREDTRARITMPADPAVLAVVAKFAGPRARLLSTGSEPLPKRDLPTDGALQGATFADASVRATLEVVHEALIRTWPELRTWLNANRDVLRARAAVVQQRKEWEANGRRPDLLLAGGFQLERGRELLGASGDVPVDDVKDYIEASEKREERRVEAKHRAEVEERERLKRQSRNRLLVAFGAIVAAIALAILAGVAYMQRAEANDLSTRYLARNAVLLSREAGKEREAVATVLRTFDSPVRGEEGELLDTVVAGYRVAFLVGSLRGHVGVVNDASFSPDGTRVVTASYDGTARLWDAHDGRPLAILAHHDNVVGAEYSRDGTRIVSASSDKTACVWDGRDGSLLATLTGHTAIVHAAKFSPDGARVVTASEDNTARIWAARDGSQMATLEGHVRGVLTAAFSPDGAEVITASEDKTGRLWDAHDGKLLAILEGHTGIVRSASFSPDGSHVVTVSEDKTGRLWDAHDGKLLAILEGHSRGVSGAAFSADGHRVVTISSDKTARLWNVRDGKLLTTLEGHSGVVRGAAFSPDGARVVTASEDKTARVWDAHDSKCLVTLKGHAGIVKGAAFSPDGNWIVTASEDGIARLWDTQDGRPMAALEGHSGSVRSVVYSPDGARLLTASEDKTARLWDAQNGRQVATLEGHAGAVTSAVYAPDGARVLTASEDKTARVWDAQSGMPVATLEGHSGVVTSAVYAPDGARVLTASEDKTARVWDAHDGKLLTTLEGHSGSVRSAAYSPDGTRVVTASEDTTARVWDARTGKLSAVLEGHSRAVRSAAFSPDGARLVTASLDGTARVWNVYDGKLQATLDGHGYAIRGVAWSPDGSRVVTGSYDGIARIWDARDGKLQSILEGHSRGILGVAYAPDGTRVVTVSADRTARVWNVRDGKLLALLDAHAGAVKSAAFSPDGTRIATASADRTARQWPANYFEGLRMICTAISGATQFFDHEQDDLNAICARVPRRSEKR